jgi:hypothetical protein
MRHVIWLSLAAAIWSAPSIADDIPPCAPPAGVISAQIPGEVPALLQQSLRSSLGEIALPGQRFQATDVYVGGPDRRFIFVWHRGDRWLVAMEHGGIAYNDPILLYQIGRSRSLRLLRTEEAIPPTVCGTAIRMINR